MTFLVLFSSFFILLPALLGLFLWKRLNNKFKLLTMYVLIFSGVETYGYILSLST